MSSFLDNEELQELRIHFMHSTQEKLDQIELLVLNSEAQRNQVSHKAIFKDILAITHSIKGSSRGYKFDTMAIICNKLEDYISGFLNHDKIVSAEELTVVLKYTDLLSSYGEDFIKNKKVDDLAFQEKFQKLFSTSHLQKDTTKRIVLSHVKVQILVVGINKIIMKQVYMGLTDISHNISFAADPLEAFHRISLEKFDLIISSFVMDPIDGMSFTLAVKNQWQEKAPHVILFCTEPLKFKYDPLLSPDKILIKSLTLPQELNDYLKHNFGPYIKTNIPVIPKTKQIVKSIFFVEDDENILELFLMVFSEKKDVVLFNEVTKSDPFDRITQLLPDLIICDIHVPKVDTMALLKKIKQYDELANTPVVFFSGDPEQPIAVELVKQGALAVLDKTIILTSMIDELEKLGINLQT